MSLQFWEVSIYCLSIYHAVARVLGGGTGPSDLERTFTSAVPARGVFGRVKAVKVSIERGENL